MPQRHCGSADPGRHSILRPIQRLQASAEPHFEAHIDSRGPRPEFPCAANVFQRSGGMVPHVCVRHEYYCVTAAGPNTWSERQLLEGSSLQRSN